MTKTVELFKDLPTYKWLKAKGIVPSTTTTYTLAQIQQAVAAKTGFIPTVGCNKQGYLSEMWYHYVVQGSVGTGKFIHSAPDGPKSSCPATGIKYVPKVPVARFFTVTLMPITTPQQLVDEYKRSGAFDLLRKKLLTEFQNTKSHEKFLERVDDIARDKLKDDVHLAYKKRDKLHEETMIELERYPLWERAVNDTKSEILERRPFYLAVDEDLSRILQTEKLNMQARGVPIVWRPGSGLKPSTPQPPAPMEPPPPPPPPPSGTPPPVPPPPTAVPPVPHYPFWGYPGMPFPGYPGVPMGGYGMYGYNYGYPDPSMYGYPGAQQFPNGYPAPNGVPTPPPPPPPGVYAPTPPPPPPPGGYPNQQGGGWN
ncbi:hypothetical protein BN14_11484 [Rhizoctonia solani AG-1 IB]|uniref:BOD1/SHG1 domain-containing protein n=1 Tax=Thanatephorus cucumeris (strain AG1-IB / isolate 7/3/14) TaxID=1108050 RepID=M5CDI1_THACB|nr:hypothetical protein BN14_11484 [Rhizoctonia solani AG-1 IB]